MGEWNADAHDFLYDMVFVLLALTSFLSITGVSMISPALPTIANTLEVGDSRIGLVVTAYTLPAIVILPFSGFAADNFGRRGIMSAGSFLIGLGGVIAILSNSFLWLLAGRVVQGVGYAGVMPLTVALLGDLYDDNKETEAQGLRTSFNKVGGILWPIVGGGLAALGWRNAFLMYLLFFPLSVLLWRRAPHPPPTKRPSPIICRAWHTSSNVHMSSRTSLSGSFGSSSSTVSSRTCRYCS